MCHDKVVEQGCVLHPDLVRLVDHSLLDSLLDVGRDEWRLIGECEMLLRVSTDKVTEKVKSLVTNLRG